MALSTLAQYQETYGWSDKQFADRKYMFGAALFNHRAEFEQCDPRAIADRYILVSLCEPTARFLAHEDRSHFPQLRWASTADVAMHATKEIYLPFTLLIMCTQRAASRADRAYGIEETSVSLVSKPSPEPPTTVVEGQGLPEGLANTSNYGTSPNPLLQLIDHNRNWRDKVVIVWFPDGKVFPFIVKAQPALRTKDSIRRTDITHKMFLDRIELYAEGGHWPPIGSVIFKDKIFGNRYDLRRSDIEFFEALMMHEYDIEFDKVTTMEVFVENHV